MDKEEEKAEYFKHVGNIDHAILKAFRSKESLLTMTKKIRQQDIISAEALKNL